jgi:PAS domain S-box-containing protein
MTEINDKEYQKLQARLNEASRMVTVVRDSNDAITIQDFEGHILAWNHGAELMFGYSEQEALKMTIWQFAPPDKAAEQKDFNRRILAGEKVVSFETQRLTKDGRLLDVWLTVTKLVDEAGKVIGIAATERDITERKRIEVETRNAAERYKALFDASSDILIQLDAAGNIVDVNQQAVTLSGYNKKELAGKNIADLTDLFTPQSLALIVANFAKRKLGVVVPPYEVEAVGGAGQKLTFEVEAVGKDGRRLSFEVNRVSLKQSAVGEADELVIMHDITERKREEENLRTSEENYRALIESATDQIFMVNEELKFMTVNSAGLSLLRKKLDEVIGHSVAEVFPKETSVNNVANLQKVFETGKNQLLNEELNFGGNRVFMSTSLSPVQNSEGKTVAVLGVVRDNTESKRVEDELKKKLADLEVFYKSAMDREDRVLELKKKVEELEKHG